MDGSRISHHLDVSCEKANLSFHFKGFCSKVLTARKVSFFEGLSDSDGVS